MFVNSFYTQKDKAFSFSRKQGSDFAKQIAGDFNPLHHPENKRFCVPGDLLFALTLSQYGVSKNMVFDFQGMVSGDSEVSFVAADNELRIENDKQKSLLNVTRSGDVCRDDAFIDALIRSYVAFSGKTFPHILVDLMSDEGSMINPEKPMVIYDLMKLSFERFSDFAPEVILNTSKFDVNGKRGMVTMYFDICANNEVIGKGEKHIIMSGLREYDQAGIDILVSNYENSKKSYEENNPN